MKTPNNEADQLDLAYQQAMQYGQDMVALYKQERQKRESLEIAYKKLEAALSGMSDGFLAVDKELLITEINQACAALFNMTVSQAQGAPLPQLLVGPGVQPFCRELSGGKPAKQTVQLDVERPIPRTLSIQAAPLPGGGWILVLHDVTWEERVKAIREEFVHLASHRLRTPLAGVMGFASLLAQMADKQNLDEETRSVLTDILTASEKLHQALNDLVISSALGDSNDLQIETVNLRTVVTDALAGLAKLRAERDVTVTVDLSQEGMWVLGNKKMLVTAVRHLIENGINFNKPGGSLVISGQKTADSYSLTFTDTGYGIAPHDCRNIVKPFYQAQTPAPHSAPGIGLGLSIVHRTLTLHRGSLQITSTPGKGSTFTAILPRYAAKGSTFTAILPRYAAKDLAAARKEWSKIQTELTFPSRQTPPVEQEQAQAIIAQLKQQLDVTQSQNMAYAQDLTKLYQLQRAEAEELEAKKAQIGHTDRLALMGQLAAGVAHDLSNLIGPILGYSQIILRRRDAIDPTMADIIERILTTSRRANVLLRQMVTLSKTHTQTFELFDLNSLAAEMLQLLEVKIRYANVDLTTAYGRNLPQVYGNPVQISQVILNIVINALDAMPSGGVLAFKTCAAEAASPEGVILQISDTGCGIPPQDLAHIFDAFFTTKAEKSGTGLGLSVTRQIIDAHGGKITVDSVVGQGTTFTILLPSRPQST